MAVNMTVTMKLLVLKTKMFFLTNQMTPRGAVLSTTLRVEAQAFSLIKVPSVAKATMESEGI